MQNQTNNSEQINLIVRTIVGALALINAVLQLNNMPHLEIGDELITSFINSGALILTSIWTYWKNNNWTQAAKTGQQVIDDLKDGAITQNEVQDFLKNPTLE